MVCRWRVCGEGVCGWRVCVGGGVCGERVCGWRVCVVRECVGGG